MSATVTGDQAAGSRPAFPDARRPNTSASGLSGTPARLMTLALLCVAIVIAAGAVAWFLTDRLVGESVTIDTSTSPVLIGNQSILASLAEADAAAAAVHLAGAAGDPEQQRVFESALERANIGLENVARVIGDDDESHEALARIGAAITTYATRVEGARVASVQELPGATAELNRAIVLLRDEISPEVVGVTNKTQARLEEDITAPYFWLAVLAIVAALVALLIAQLWMTRRFSRLLNLPLVVASLILAALAVWMGLSFLTQQDALNDAQTGGYEAIEITAAIQSAAFEYRANETAAVIEAQAPDLFDLEFELSGATEITPDIVARARLGEADDVGLLFDAVREADSPREHAATAEMLTRWGRYVETSRELEAAALSGNAEAAAEIVRGSSNSAFAGFNTSVEAALYDNREQFSGAVEAARTALNNLRLGIAIATIVAALAAWWGFTLRLQEYR